MNYQNQRVTFFLIFRDLNSDKKDINDNKVDLVIKQLRRNSKVAQSRAYFSLLLILLFFIGGIYYTYKSGDISQLETQEKLLESQTHEIVRLNAKLNTVEDELEILLRGNIKLRNQLDSVQKWQPGVAPLTP